jgi:hypothetical protein
MTARFAISVAAMFVMLLVLGFVIHGILLQGEYVKLVGVMRPPEQVADMWPFMLLSYLCTAVAFSWIYLKGKEDKWWLEQGLRYGIAVIFLVTIPVYLLYYATMPLPLVLVLRQMTFDSIMIVLMGIVLAWINR